MIGVVYLLFTSTMEYGLVARDVYTGHSINPAASGDSWKQFIATVAAGLGAVLMEG